MKQQRGFSFYWLVVVSLIMAVLACNTPVRIVRSILPASTVAAVQTKTPAGLAKKQTKTPARLSTIPTETPTRLAKATPAVDTPTPTIIMAPERVEYLGVSFDRIPEVFSEVNSSIAPLEEGEVGETGWMGPSPEYYLFEFQGYALPSTWIQPQILVYPIWEYAAVNPPAGEVAAKLDAVLRSVETSQYSLPFLPMWNAGQVFHARSEILTFQNGKGLRYLTCYAQDMGPIDEQCLFYTFQGLTQDGQYYVAAILPMNLPELHTAEMTSLWEAFTQDYDTAKYEEYLKKVIQTLEVAEERAFSPDLKQLDALFTSLKVTPSISLKAPTTPER